MPTYEYFCDKCEMASDVIKPIAELDRQEPCIQCSQPMRKLISLPQFVGTAQFDPHYSLAFGKPITSKRQLKYEVDRTGAIEVGNEKVETVHKHFDNAREEKRKKRWESD